MLSCRPDRRQRTRRRTHSTRSRRFRRTGREFLNRRLLWSRQSWKAQGPARVYCVRNPPSQPGGFFLGFCRARHDVDQRALQSDVPWCGWDHRRTELSNPSLLELPLKVKWDYAHSRSSRSGSPQHSQANASRGLKVPGTAWAASQNLRLWGAISETKRALKRLQLKHTSSLEHVPTVEGCVRCGSADPACGKAWCWVAWCRQSAVGKYRIANSI